MPLDAQFWHDKAAEELEKRKNLMTNKKAKNIILFLGDGMSGSTVTAARILQAERNNISLSQAEPLSFENFIVTGLSRVSDQRFLLIFLGPPKVISFIFYFFLIFQTYCLDYYVADSACSATAYLCGCKGNVGTVGVTAAVKPKNAKASVDPNNRVHSFAYAAQKAGW